MRVWNFSAGPAALPEPVLREAAEQMLDWRGSGMGVMEMSHRGPEFMSIHAEAQADLRRLLGVPDGYATLFLQGGAIAENAIVPMNLLRGHARADYLVTGQWSKKSAEEAGRYAEVNVVADARGAFGGFTGVPDQATWRCARDAAYLHLCTNETIDGVELFDPVVRAGLDTADAVARVGAGAVPEGVPVVADVSSHLLSRPMDVSRFGCLYGGAQKNIGPAGLTIVVVREDLIGQAHSYCPTAFDWKVVADADSMYNTPPTWAIYVAGLVFKWIDAQGGIAAIEAANVAKAAILYDAIDASGLYVNHVRAQNRSRMNVPFHLREPALEKAFLAGAAERGLVQLKGHRSVGGLRASIYNAMPVEGVRALVEWMHEFEKTRG